MTMQQIFVAKWSGKSPKQEEMGSSCETAQRYPWMTGTKSMVGLFLMLQRKEEGSVFRLQWKCL